MRPHLKNHKVFGAVLVAIGIAYILGFSPKAFASKVPATQNSGKTCRPNKALKGIRTLVFISLGMPENDLKDLLSQGSGRRDVMFVLRGWKPPDIYAVFRKVRKLSPEKKPAPNVVIDPVLFSGYHIDSVPVIISKAKNNRWYRVTGEISIQGAEKLVAEGKAGKNKPPVGQLYPISEPDILAVIHKRIKHFNWPAEIARLKTQVKHPMEAPAAVDLPTATKDASYPVDLSVEATRDIKLPNGTVVIAKGSVFNPLNYITMHHRYVFFDPAEPRQMAAVRHWLKSFPHQVMLIATRNALGAAKKLGKPVYPANSMLIQRFRIIELPSMVSQDGSEIKIEVKKCAN